MTTPLAPRRRRLLVVVTVLLVLGFVATSLASYLVSGMALREQVKESGLPLTSDNIYSDIQNDLLPPILVSSTMAQDTFLRDWVLNGEQDISKIVRYLTEVRSRNNTISAFFVSEGTRQYYHPSGIVEQVTTEDPSDAWYFHVRTMKPDYEINVDYDQANAFALTIFINYKVFDYDDNLIGATGVGLQANSMLQRLDRYEERYKREIYFVDPRGGIILQAGNDNQKAEDIHAKGGLGALADRILTVEEGSWEYQRGGESVLLNTRYIPELDWYLFVEQSASAATAPVRKALILNLLVGLSIAAVVVALTHVMIQSYQRRLERMATTDNLTGLANRHSFEMQVEPYVFRSAQKPERAPRDSVVLFDLDQLKQVNDENGHIRGDEVIRSVADLARQVMRATDVICRWGGEEFVIWLHGCSLDDATGVAEKIREMIGETVFTDGVRVTASFGVVEHCPGDPLEYTISRADEAMYTAKTQGRDRVRVAA